MTITTSRPAPLDIDALRSRFSGWVIGPADPDYDAERTVLPGGIDSHPAVIVRVAGTDDVRAVIALARETGHELAVRAGGHSAAAHSTVEGGIVLDVRDLDSFDIDVEGRTAWAGRRADRARVHEGRRRARPRDRVRRHGVGRHRRAHARRRHRLPRPAHGLAIDNLLGAEIVTADGEVHVVDADHEPDLFWAIRGGGGNLGVATRFHYRLHPVTEVTGGMLVLPATPAAVAGPRGSDEAPDALSRILNVMPCPPMPFVPEEYHGSTVIMALLCYAGPPDEASGSWPRSGRSPSRSPTWSAPSATPRCTRRRTRTTTRRRSQARSSSTRSTSRRPRRPRADRGVRRRRSGSPAAAARRRLGEGPGRRDGLCAPGHRFMANVAAFYAGPATSRRRRPGSTTSAGASTRAGAYVNFIADEGEARVHDAYPPATWERLARIKRRYDPDNLFHRNQNVPPSEG